MWYILYPITYIIYLLHFCPHQLTRVKLNYPGGVLEVPHPEKPVLMKDR